MSVRTLLRDPLRVSALITLLACVSVSASIVAADVAGTAGVGTGGGGSQSSSGESDSGRSSSSKGDDGGGGFFGCWLQLVACEKIKPACTTLPSVIEVPCSDSRCGSGHCLLKSDVGEAGQAGYRYYRTSLCSYVENPCPPTNLACGLPLRIRQIACDDARCTAASAATVAGQTRCDTSIAIADKDGKIFGNFQGWEDEEDDDEEEDEGDGGGGGNRGGAVGGIIGGTTGGSGNSGTGGKDHDDDEKEEEEKENRNNGNEDTKKNSNAVGCFTKEGIWTEVRALCDPDQGRHLGIATRRTSGQQSSASAARETQASSAREIAIVRRVEEKFIPQEERDEHLRNLLSLTSNAIERLALLINSGLLPPDTVTRLQTMATGFKQVLSAYSIGSQSVREIQDEALRVRTALEEMQEGLRAAVATTPLGQPRLPTNLTLRIDRILAAVPQIVTLFQREQIAFPAAGTAAYAEAARLYQLHKNPCLLDSGACLELKLVVDQLQVLMTSIHEALVLAGRPELEGEINGLMQ